MPVNTEAKGYTSWKSKWSRCRHAVAGSDDVKAQKSTYLPVPGGLSAAEPRYLNYVARAKWFPATARTIDGLEGEVFRNPPQTETPSKMEEWLEDVTLTGLTFNQYARQVIRERLATGRYGELVDWSEDLGRPYIVGFAAENILNWRTENIDGDQTLTMVVLLEQVEDPDNTDEFETDTIDQYRVLKLVDGIYVSELWQDQAQSESEGGSSDAFRIVDTAIPTRRGQRLDYIPFTFYGVAENSPTPEKPPLLDLVDLNLADFRNSADLEHGRHFCGLPFYYLFGADEVEDESGGEGKDSTEIEVGSSEMFTSSNADAKVGVVEFSGQGLGALEKAREENRTEMTVMGARVMEEMKAVGETTEAIARRQSGKLSVLQAMVEVQNEAHEQSLRWMAEWIGAAEDIQVSLNKDFTVSKLEPTAIQQLIAAWQGGAISKQTLFENLQTGEIISQDRTYEDEQELIEDEAPDFDQDLPVTIAS
jgi:hypothetical protein